jgi:AraC family transcriptional regulator
LPELGRSVADAPIIERHNQTFDPRTGEGGIALWVPLAD